MDVEPFGGNDGSEWDDGRVIGRSMKEIIVENENLRIISITVVYNHNGTSDYVQHGVGRNNPMYKISLDFPKEYLIGVAGFVSTFYDGYKIRSLIFTTNKRKYAPIGRAAPRYLGDPRDYVEFKDHPDYFDYVGDYFDYCVTGDHSERFHISSFSGRSGEYLDVIGFHLSPLAEAQAKAHETVPEELTDNKTGKSNRETYGPFRDEDGYGRHRKKVPMVDFSGITLTSMDTIGSIDPFDSKFNTLPKNIVRGPWGGESGKIWDDGTYAAVKKIRVAYDDNVITSIYVEYDDNGCPVSCLHGGIGGRDRITITLNYPGEFLTSISGFTGLVRDMVVLRSLTFKSNKRTFQSIGIPYGKHFSSEKDESGNDFRITGFFGRSSFFINAIGIHISSPTQILGGGICKTIWQKVRNFVRTASTSPSKVMVIIQKPRLRWFQFRLMCIR